MAPVVLPPLGQAQHAAAAAASAAAAAAQQALAAQQQQRPSAPEPSDIFVGPDGAILGPSGADDAYHLQHMGQAVALPPRPLTSDSIASSFAAPGGPSFSSSSSSSDDDDGRGRSPGDGLSGLGSSTDGFERQPTTSTSGASGGAGPSGRTSQAGATDDDGVLARVSLPGDGGAATPSGGKTSIRVAVRMRPLRCGWC